MEIDRIAFPARLLEVIEAISEAHFVAFDLELSGVSSKREGGKKQTLEERYRETKESAERYTILQFGLTCVQQDADKDRYVARPYNFNLNPVVEERLDMERIFSFQSGAVEFLLSHGFKIDLPFTQGVPYLSRDEAALAKKLAYERFERKNMEDLQLKEEDVEAIEFVRQVREVINAWKETGQPDVRFVNITNNKPLEKVSSDALPALSRFEKRLVHQLVRAEHKDLVTLSKRDFIQIIRYDEENEKEILKRKKRRLREQIIKQTGFRWIIEALVGGDLNRIDARSFIVSVATGMPKAGDLGFYQRRWDRAKGALKTRRPVLVGHNLFTDLVYLYKCFIGDLPPTLAGFTAAIHELFPVIVDTKYMATHNCGDLNPASSLEEIEEKLRLQARPHIEIDPKHTKYAADDGAEAFHEAGYDSLLTANIMVRLSAKLQAAGTYKKEVETAPGHISSDEAYHTAPEDAGGILAPAHPSLGHAATEQEKSAPALASKHTDIIITAAANAATPLLTPPIIPTAPPFTKTKAEADVKTKRKSAGTPAPISPPPKSRFSHITIFDSLRALALSDADSDSDADFGDASSPTPTLPTQPNNALEEPAFASHPAPTAAHEDRKAQTRRMPPFGGAFWAVYGNKLRVFGTVEGVCWLGDTAGAR